MINTLVRYRSLAVVLATAVVIVAVARVGDPDTSRVTSGPLGASSFGAGAVDTGSGAMGPDGSTAGTAAAGVAGAGGGGAASTGKPGPAGTGTGASTGGPAGSASGAPVATATATADGSGGVVVNGVSYPGIGTEAALSNPNCDRATGRIRVPTFAAATCVAKWPKGADNLGATAPGVTKDKIRIVLTYTRGDTSTEDSVNEFKDIAQGLTTVFQEHHELWGRTIDLQFFERSGTDEVAQRADATEVFNKLKPFMTVDPTIAARPMVVFSAEMAARGVIAWDHQTPWKDAQALAGYRWGVGHDERLFAEHIAEFVAKSLQGRPARWAGEPPMQVENRKFGLIYPDTWDIDFFNQAKQKFGLTTADQIAYKTGDLTSYQEQSRVHMARFDDAGVNNIIAGAELFYLTFATVEATSRNYFPEWTLTGWGVSDVTLGGRLYDKAQVAHMFGIGPVPVLVDNEHQVTNRIYAWEHGRQPADAATAGTLHLLFESIYFGLQNAGPNLNAQTFRNALFTAPPSGGYWCGCISSTGLSWGRRIEKPWDDYSSWDDMTFKWWKADEQSQDEIGLQGAGTFVMIDRGKRYVPGAYPTQEPPFFVNENTAHHLNFEDLPPPDKPPPYEHDESLHTNYGGD